MDAFAKLLHAIGAINHEMAKKALDGGADPNAPDGESGYSAFERSIQSGDLRMVALLLSYGADLNAKSEGKWPPNKSVGGDFVSQFGRTPLMTACMFGTADIAKLLLERGALINATDNGGRTALMLAYSRRSGRRGSDIADILIKAGADQSIRDKNGRTAKDYKEHRYDD